MVVFLFLLLFQYYCNNYYKLGRQNDDSRWTEQHKEAQLMDPSINIIIVIIVSDQTLIIMVVLLNLF